MTTQNTAGTLTNRIILSAAYDPTGTASTVPEYKPIQQAIDTGTNKAAPNHWQDTVPNSIMDRTVGTSPRLTTSLTPGNEFELDVESLTHTWQTVSTVAPLPGLAQIGDSSGPVNSAQIAALNIDLGMMREIMSVQGILYDADNHPSSTSGHHIRRQQLLDIARTQWGNVHNYNRGTAFEWNNANKYPAITIGPLHGRATSGADRDFGYFGDEPSSDVRGLQQRTISFVQQLTPVTIGSAQHYAGGNYSWDSTFNYKGRRRYRGLIRRLTITALPGQPNIWRFNFDFEIIKNELELRMMAEDKTDKSNAENRSGGEDAEDEGNPWWHLGFGGYGFRW